jgi:ribosomal protein S18 acetylase RimI-like enzyme
MAKGQSHIAIRAAVEADLEQVIALDERVTGTRKQAYWRDLYQRYRARRSGERFFYVADTGDNSAVIGFVIGEIRAWEFGSAPCGWVFAISVDPDARLDGIGNALLAKISASFKQAGVDKLRTMVPTGNHLLLSFFRSEGLTAGPYLQLEKDIDD